MSKAGYMKALSQSSLGRVKLWGLELIMNVKFCMKVTNPIYQHILHLGYKEGHSPLIANDSFQNVNA